MTIKVNWCLKKLQSIIYRKSYQLVLKRFSTKKIFLEKNDGNKFLQLFIERYMEIMCMAN